MHSKVQSAWLVTLRLQDIEAPQLKNSRLESDEPIKTPKSTRSSPDKEDPILDMFHPDCVRDMRFTSSPQHGSDKVWSLLEQFQQLKKSNADLQSILKRDHGFLKPHKSKWQHQWSMVFNLVIECCRWLPNIALSLQHVSSSWQGVALCWPGVATIPGVIWPRQPRFTPQHSKRQWGWKGITFWKREKQDPIRAILQKSKEERSRVTFDASTLGLFVHSREWKIIKAALYCPGVAAIPGVLRPATLRS